MRLIGSANPLPIPVRNDISTSFSVLELRDYYIPNDKDIILRYVVMSLQFWSRSDTVTVDICYVESQPVHCEQLGGTTEVKTVWQTPFSYY